MPLHEIPPDACPSVSEEDLAAMVTEMSKDVDNLAVILSHNQAKAFIQEAMSTVDGNAMES